VPEKGGSTNGLKRKAWDSSFLKKGEGGNLKSGLGGEKKKKRGQIELSAQERLGTTYSEKRIGQNA